MSPAIINNASSVVTSEPNEGRNRGNKTKVVRGMIWIVIDSVALALCPRLTLPFIHIQQISPPPLLPARRAPTSSPQLSNQPWRAASISTLLKETITERAPVFVCDRAGGYVLTISCQEHWMSSLRASEPHAGFGFLHARRHNAPAG